MVSTRSQKRKSSDAEQVSTTKELHFERPSKRRRSNPVEQPPSVKKTNILDEASESETESDAETNSCGHVGAVNLEKAKLILARPSSWSCQAKSCGTTASVWICLECGYLGCGSQQNGHSEKHYEQSHHAIAFEINEKKCFCYVCSKHVANDNRRGDIEAFRHMLDESATLTFKPSLTRSGRILRPSNHVGVTNGSMIPTSDNAPSATREMTAEEWQRCDKMYTAVQHWRLFTLARAFNKWKELLIEKRLRTAQATATDTSTIATDNDRIPPTPNTATATTATAMETDTVPSAAATSLKITHTPLRRTLLVPGQTGLRNLGNTCYMNAVLQALCNSGPFREYFIERFLPRTLPGPLSIGGRTMWRRDTIDCLKQLQRPAPALVSQISIAMELHQIFRVLWSGKWASATPVALLDAVWKCVPKFRGHQQQDAEEFLLYLLDRVQSELSPKPPAALPAPAAASDTAAPASDTVSPPRMPLRRRLAEAGGQTINGCVPTTGIVQQTFEGKTVSRVTCLECRHVSTRCEPFLALEISIPAEFLHIASARRRRRGAPPPRPPPECRLEQCLQAFTLPERLEWASYACDKCCQSERADHRVPAEKAMALSAEALPPVLVIVLKRFCWIDTARSPCKIDTVVRFPLHGLDLGPYLVNPAVPDAPRGTSGAALYDLLATVIHHGMGLQTGHYTAYCYNKAKATWLHYNDSVVALATEDEVAACQPYLLFYERRIYY